MATPTIKGMDLFSHSRPLEQPVAPGNCTFSGIVPIALRRFKQSGVSAGGELALALGLRHPDVYGAIFCASPGGGYKPT
ncbi:MAG: hypothetical protein J2P36_29710, partial [Ktedonobacteraceae bacterium]|nr:hypothetical protein [Ktedonobacteraceae bacterium]